MNHPSFVEFAGVHRLAAQRAFLLLGVILAFALHSRRLIAEPPEATEGTKLAFQSTQVGHVFPSQKGAMELWISDADRLLSGKVVISNEEGRLLKEIEIHAGKPRVRIDLSSKGFYFLNAIARYQDGSSATNQTTAAVIGLRIPDEQRLRSRFGIFGVNTQSPLAVVAGVRWNRRFICIGCVEESPDGFRWEESIKKLPPQSEWGLVEAPRNQTWITCFGPLPQWMMTPRPGDAPGEYGNPPNNWDRFEALVRWAVSSHPQKTRYFEVINEPELYWKGTKEELVRYHQVIATVVKSVRPGALVIGPCPSTVNLPYLKSLVDLGILKHLDGLAMHAYVDSGVPPEGDFIEKIQELKGYLASLGKEDFPIYLTEFGWTTAPRLGQTPVDELTQARYVSRSLTLLAGEGVHAILYFCLQYKTSNAGDREFSVLRDDNSPKPAFAAYANVVRWLTDAEGRGRWLRITPTSNLVLFRKGKGAVAVAWDTQGSSTLFVPRPWRRVEDMMGRRVSDASTPTLSVTPSPTFIGLDDASLYDIEMLPPVSVRAGASAEFPVKRATWWCPAPVTLTDETVVLPATAKPGEYLVIGKVGNRWQGLPVQVVSP